MQLESAIFPRRCWEEPRHRREETHDRHVLKTDLNYLYAVHQNIRGDFLRSVLVYLILHAVTVSRRWLRWANRQAIPLPPSIPVHPDQPAGKPAQVVSRLPLHLLSPGLSPRSPSSDVSGLEPEPGVREGRARHGEQSRRLCLSGGRQSEDTVGGVR